MSRRDRRAEAQRRTIDRRIVMDDARRAGKAFRELRTKEGITTEPLTFDDPMPDDPSGGEGMLVNLVIGTRDKLALEEAEAAARKWMEVVQKYPADTTSLRRALETLIEHELATAHKFAEAR